VSITWADVVAYPAPELSTLATASQTAILAIVDRQIDVDAWGEFADDGRRLLAAHLGTLTRSGAGGAAGPVTSETLGAMSRSYASMTTDAGLLGTTKYGAEYLRLMRIAVGVAVLVP
jgi:hypothetical protein